MTNLFWVVWQDGKAGLQGQDSLKHLSTKSGSLKSCKLVLTSLLHAAPVCGQISVVGCRAMFCSFCERYQQRGAFSNKLSSQLQFSECLFFQSVNSTKSELGFRVAFSSHTVHICKEMLGESTVCKVVPAPPQFQASLIELFLQQIYPASMAARL